MLFVDYPVGSVFAVYVYFGYICSDHRPVRLQLCYTTVF